MFVKTIKIKKKKKKKSKPDGNASIRDAFKRFRRNCATVSYNSVCGYSGFREVTVTKTETETPFFNL